MVKERDSQALGQASAFPPSYRLLDSKLRTSRGPKAKSLGLAAGLLRSPASLSKNSPTSRKRLSPGSAEVDMPWFKPDECCPLIPVNPVKSDLILNCPMGSHTPDPTTTTFCLHLVSPGSHLKRKKLGKGGGGTDTHRSQGNPAVATVSFCAGGCAG